MSASVALNERARPESGHSRVVETRRRFVCQTHRRSGGTKQSAGPAIDAFGLAREMPAILQVIDSAALREHPPRIGRGADNKEAKRTMPSDSSRLSMPLPASARA
jgi:hypothetical protein